MTIGERIQMYRKSQGLSQEDLAQKIFVSRQTVSQWETDQTVPSIDNIYRLKEVLGVSFDELLSDEKAEKKETEEEKPLEEYEYTPDEEEAKATIKFISKFDIKQSVVIIGLMILLGLCFSILDASETTLGVILGIIVFFIVGTVYIAVNDSTMKKKQLKNMKCKSQCFRLFEDYLELTFVSDEGGKSQYVIKKEEISDFFENDKYYAFISKQMIFSIRKDVLKETSILRNFIYKERSKESKKSAVLSKTLMVLSFVLGICADAVGIVMVNHYNLPYEAGMWFLLACIPIPIASGFYGICRIVKKKDGAKNIIAGVLGFVLLCTSFNNMVRSEYSAYEDEDMFGFWNELTELDIPDNGTITNTFYGEDEYESEIGCYSTSMVVYDKETAELFAEQISDDERWETEIPEEMKEFVVDFRYDIGEYDYYSIYNTCTGCFSDPPEETGAHNYILFAYDVSEGVLQVEDYTVEVAAE